MKIAHGLIFAALVLASANANAEHPVSVRWVPPLMEGARLNVVMAQEHNPRAARRQQMNGYSYIGYPRFDPPGKPVQFCIDWTSAMDRYGNTVQVVAAPNCWSITAFHGTAIVPGVTGLSSEFTIMLRSALR